MILMTLFNKAQFKTWMERSHPDFREHLQAIGKKCRYSDLAIHTGDAGKTVDSVYVSENDRYAFGLVNGHIIDGLFTEHGDGKTVSFS